MHGTLGRRRTGRGALPVLVACAAYLAFVAPAAAQVGAGSGPALQKPEPDAPKQTPSLPSTGETLSERLDRNDGVIRPPAQVDPGMAVTPKDPSAGSAMPVIPPPGSPGGDQSIQPK